MPKVGTHYIVFLLFRNFRPSPKTGRRAPTIARNGTMLRQSRNSHGINANANTNPNMIATDLAHPMQRLKTEIYLFMIVVFYMLLCKIIRIKRHKLALLVHIFMSDSTYFWQPRLLFLRDSGNNSLYLEISRVTDF